MSTTETVDLAKAKWDAALVVWKKAAQFQRRADEMLQSWRGIEGIVLTVILTAVYMIVGSHSIIEGLLMAVVFYVIGWVARLVVLAWSKRWTAQAWNKVSAAAAATTAAKRS